MLEIGEVAYGGWQRNLRIANADVELIVTLEVGPRILRYAPIGGRNLFGEVSQQLGGSGEAVWRMRGGHRLWISPEDPVRTYLPDNTSVTETRIVDAGGVERVQVTAAADREFGLERTMEIALGPRGSDVVIVHRVRNLGEIPRELAVWALTVLAQGGIAVVPLPTPRLHPGEGGLTAADFAPNVHMSFWPYFRFDDPRVGLGHRYLRLRQDPNAAGPTKLGLAHREGWASYWNDGVLFVKRFAYDENATYPDGGCNFETYTDRDILELESLGPLVQLAPGGEISHRETWSLHARVPAPSSEHQIDGEWSELLARRP
jgi:hypothetical protein